MDPLGFASTYASCITYKTIYTDDLILPRTDEDTLDHEDVRCMEFIINLSKYFFQLVRSKVKLLACRNLRGGQNKMMFTVGSLDQ